MALPAFAALRRPAAHAAAVTYGQSMPDRRLPSQPPLNRYRIYCLVTEASACEQLAQGCYLKAEQPRKSSTLTTICVAGVAGVMAFLCVFVQSRVSWRRWMMSMLLEPLMLTNICSYLRRTTQ